MIKKILCLAMVFFMLFALAACEDLILKKFDLSDPDDYQPIQHNSDFEVDRVVVILKRTSTYPELKLKHFKLDNAESLEYYFLKPDDSYNNENFRQILVIYLKTHGKEQVLDAIKELEKLKFVKTAQPEYIYSAVDE